MDFNALEKTWVEQTVTGGALSADKIVVQLRREVRSAQRRLRGAMVIALSLLLLSWTLAFAAHFMAIKRFTPIALIDQTVGSILYIALFARALRTSKAVQTEMAEMGKTVLAAVAATLRTVELQIQNARIAALAIPAAVAIAAWLFLAKYFAGEIPGFGAAAGAAFTVALGAAIGAAIWRHYRTELAPRRDELRELLHSLASENLPL